MIDNQQQSRGFFATIPGIMTALAAVLTAAGGLFFGIQGRDGSEGDRGNQPPIVVNLPTTPAQSAPTDSTPVDPSALRLSDAVTEVSDVGSADEELITDCAAGDGQACIDLLDALAQECYDGYGLSCDMLYLISPEGSDYEAYGATCGARLEDDSLAGSCEEQ